jgi:hypothetical protein
MLIRTFMTTISREFVARLARAQKPDLYRRGYETTRTILPIKIKFAEEGRSLSGKQETRSDGQIRRTSPADTPSARISTN